MRKLIPLCSTLLALASSAQTRRINILPGIGVVINTDSILLRSAALKSVADYFNVKDSSQSAGITYLAFDQEGNEICGYYEMKRIGYKGLDFEFQGPTVDSLSLTTIYVNPESEAFDIYVNNMKLKDNKMKILRKFRHSSSTYSLESTVSDYGILFKTVRRNRRSKISLISVQSK
jgi:hypothetical protein